MGKSEKRKNDGFVLVWALLLMVVLLILGTSGIGTSVFDSFMAANTALHKQAFYEADGGTEIGEGLIFANSICTATQGGFKLNPQGAGFWRVGDNVLVNNQTFSQNTTLTSPPSDTNRDLAFYPTLSQSDGTLATPSGGNNPNDSFPHTNLAFKGSVQANPGSGAAMVSGYLGLGQSSIGGGSSSLYQIDSMYTGERKSTSFVTTQWRLDLGIVNSASSFDCKY